VDPASHRITGTYGGDALHRSSVGRTDPVVAKRLTETSVSCDPQSIPVRAQTTCAATVRDVDSGDPINPQGTVDLAVDHVGQLSALSCTLDPVLVTDDTSSCQFTYKPQEIDPDPGTRPGEHLIFAAYRGGPLHAGSWGDTTVGVVERITETRVSCLLPEVTVDTTTHCEALVTDVAAGDSLPPSGNVTLVSDHNGDLVTTPCDLTPVAGENDRSLCTFDYTPHEISDGHPEVRSADHVITGTYAGDLVHSGSAGAAHVAVTDRETRIEVSCNPAGLPVDSTTTCTAKAFDTDDPTRSDPTGTVSFTGPSGQFPGGSTCVLVRFSDEEARCQVTYKPTVVGPTDPSDHTVSASYGGDSKHRISGPAQTTVSVRKRTTQTSVTCLPGSFVAGTSTTCTAKVQDTDDASRSNPSGTVAWGTDHADGTFGSATCTLQPQGGTDDTSTCEVTYTATAAADHKITADYGGDPKHKISKGNVTVAVTRTNTLRISLDPPDAINPVDTTHCVDASATDEYGNVADGITVLFTVVGPNGTETETASGPVPSTVSRTTDSSGIAEYCYVGALAGRDTITAYLDYSPRDGRQSPGEDSDTATKLWVPFPGVPCTVGGEGGRIIVETEAATFGNLSEYVQHGDLDPFNAHLSAEVILCSTDFQRATIFGTASINGAGTHAFRMDVQDLDQSPAKGVDTFRIRFDTDYDSTEQPLAGGNIKVGP
jgi:hypothetical protein